MEKDDFYFYYYAVINILSYFSGQKRKKGRRKLFLEYLMVKVEGGRIIVHEIFRGKVLNINSEGGKLCLSRNSASRADSKVKVVGESMYNKRTYREKRKSLELLTFQSLIGSSNFKLNLRKGRHWRILQILENSFSLPLSPPFSFPFSLLSTISHMSAFTFLNSDPRTSPS